MNMIFVNDRLINLDNIECIDKGDLAKAELKYFIRIQPKSGAVLMLSFKETEERDSTWSKIIEHSTPKAI